MLSTGIFRALLTACLLCVGTGPLLSAPQQPVKVVRKSHKVATVTEKSGQDNVAFNGIGGEVLLKKGQKAEFFIVEGFAKQIEWYSWNDGEVERRNREVTPSLPPDQQLPSMFNKVRVTRAKTGRDIKIDFILEALVPRNN